MTGDDKLENVLFLSGKMTGLPDYGTAAFNHWERFFRAQGKLVMNPACLPKDLPPESYMPITLAMLDQCDEVFMLPGWADSPGAMIERNYAIKCGKDITYIADYAEPYDAWLRKIKKNEADVPWVDF